MSREDRQTWFEFGEKVNGRVLRTGPRRTHGGRVQWFRKKRDDGRRSLQGVDGGRGEWVSTRDTNPKS